MKPFITILLMAIATSVTPAQQPPATSVRDVAHSVQDSIVVVTTEDRNGDEVGMGTGFVIDQRGLIATALHVIGEARPIWVQTRDGKRYPVTEVYASDRTFDLAIVRIDPKSKLPVIPLAQNAFSEGQVAIAVGHPLGLQHSVVSGIVSGERDFSGADMWQVAMAIEPGNSGGPLLDLQGNAHGVVALKSVGSNSFGFAVKIGQLRQLIKNPNPTAMEQWQTIGQLDPERWSVRMGSRWRQRGGIITAEKPGDGFGGRSLLLRADQAPALPLELAVSVKLDDPAGAAGLVFESDNNQEHFGFYPSNGKLRLTHFQGASVFDWKVLREESTEAFKPGEWNEIKIRIEAERLQAFVNNQLLTELPRAFKGGAKIGLCKFRDTRAKFKNFRFAKQLKSEIIPTQAMVELERRLAELARRELLTDSDLANFDNTATANTTVLEKQARELEERATALRALRTDLHISHVCTLLKKTANTQPVDLLVGSLLIAQLDNPDVNVQAYVDIVNGMAKRITDTLPDSPSERARLNALNTFLFEKAGYHGSRTEYYDVANSHLDRVIDDREGLPITLSVLYGALAKRLGLNIVGVGLPSHFMVRHEPSVGDSQLIDVFDGGKLLSKSEVSVKIFRLAGRTPTDADFRTASPSQILSRMLNNLRVLAQRNEDTPSMLRYVEAMVAVAPEDASLRGIRGILRHQQGRKAAALEDLDWVLNNPTSGLDVDEVRAIRQRLSQ